MGEKYRRKTAHRKAPPHAFKKGQPRPANAGRRKGTPNKITTDVKRALLQAFTQLGADKYLVRQGKVNPRAFLAILGRAIPTQLTGKNDGPIEILQQKFMGGLANLNDKELALLKKLYAKIGITESDIPEES